MMLLVYVHLEFSEVHRLDGFNSWLMQQYLTTTLFIYNIKLSDERDDELKKM
jgi:hypothetical protein